MDLPATLDHLPHALAFAEKEAEAAGVMQKKLTGLSLAVEEAFVNICTHAYKGGAGQVELACFTGFEPFPHSFVLEISDYGPEFDLLSIPEPDTSLGIEEREIGGLGVHFIRHFTDHTDWRRENGKNILRLIFHCKDVQRG
ncbi:MAG: ATP-binding protein [Proteobacteria bacterium]|nr:ATP-binding protein [Pseudomonadota bacterium]